MKKKSLVILCLALFSANSFAEHIIGAAVGYGTQKFKLNQTSNDGDAFNLDAYYRYMVNQSVGIEGGWTSGVGGIGSIIVGQLSEVKDANFSGPKINAFFQYPLTQKNVIYTKLGVNNYTVDYTINDISKSNSEIGFEGSLGFESRFDSGFGLNIEYKHINSSIIEANQFMAGMSFKF